MSAAEATGAPPLAKLVLAGEAQTAAVAINDFIFMAQDVSNAYLVTTPAGDLLINTGFPTSAERNRALFSPVRSGPLRYIVLTQSHSDHYGGLEALREPGAQIVAERRFVETLAFYQELAPYFDRRTGKLWGTTVGSNPDLDLPKRIEPHILVDSSHYLELGGRQFEFISTPGGETLDSLTVWLPDEKIAFIGNLLGPVFMSMPFLNTLRGDKPRSVARYLSSLDQVRSLGAELLITGHGQPIRGGETIRTALDRLHAAVAYVNQATKAGMNDGKDLWTLMREIRLPDHLRIGEFHGNVPWAVRAIWHEYSGWFLYETTTELYGLPRASVDADIAELAGGAAALAVRARERLDGGGTLQALHLLDIALGADPANLLARQVKRQALEQLHEASGGQNLSETMWLRSEIAALGPS